MKTIRVAIADDHPIFRRGLASLFDKIDDIEIVGEASTGEEIIALASKVEPDVILMDIQMPPGTNGIEATRQIVEIIPHVHVLIITSAEDEASLFVAIRAGAHGYLRKDTDPEDAVRMIRDVANGQNRIGPTIAYKMLAYFSTKQQDTAETSLMQLTNREREILTYIVRGDNNRQIMEKLIISENTLKNYITSIYQKLHVKERVKAMIRGRELGLE